MLTRLLAALLGIVTLANSSPAAYEPVHEPLDCMKRFRCKEFALVGWSFHKRGGGDYDESFMRVAKGAGFNVMMDVDRMLGPADKTGMKVLIAAVWYTVPQLEGLAKGTMKHPAAIGYNLYDNCSNVPGRTIACSKWMLQNCPDLIAYFAENPNVKLQARTPLRVISTQNYAFGYNNTGPDDDKRRNYCSSLEYDRRAANQYDMTFWPIFASLANSTVGDTEIRFQTYAAVAYGAQGAVSFAYSVNRPQWNPKTGSVYKASAWTNRYIQDVVGRHVIGCRSITVFHTPNRNDMPRGAERPGNGKLIETMDPALLAGVLVVEKDFKSKQNTPAYVMVVDKRTIRNNRAILPDRVAHVTLGPPARVVEILERKTGADSDRIRVIEPAWIVPLRLKAGDGRLVRINPPDLEQILGRDCHRGYVTILGRISDLRRAIAKGRLTAAAFEAAFAEATQQRLKLERSAAARRDPQRRDVLRRLQSAMARVREAAFRPQFVSEGSAFIDTQTVELKMPLVGADIRYTLDGKQPTASSKKYTGPFRLDGTTTVKAASISKDPPGPVAQAEIKFTRVQGDVGAGLKINFQPRGVPVPKGAFPDCGEVFATRGSGWAYGWSMDRSTSARLRRRSKDPLKATQVGFLPGVTWELLLANGTYEVTVCVGDVDYGIWNASIWAEDVEFFRDIRLGPGQSHQVTKTVTVRDGRLTLRSHDRARRDRLTRINFVEIRKK